MLGWRARLGLLVPAPNTVIEPEFASMVPPGVSTHAARMQIQGDPGFLEVITKMAEGTEAAADQLSFCADVIAYACTAGSFANGSQWDVNLIHRIEKVTGKPATTTARSLVQAARALGSTNLVVATPYRVDVNDHMANYLQENGLKVLNIRGLGLYKAGDPAKVQSQALYALVKDAYLTGCDCILISCTDMPTVHLIGPIEKDFGVPVITSNQATFWHLLRLAGIRGSLPEFGRLMSLDLVDAKFKARAT